MAASPLRIKLRCTSWRQVSQIYERDLLRSALFLKSAAPPPVGTTVSISLTLPTQTLLVLNGVIAEHVPPGGLDGRGPGVDIKLHNVPHSAMWLIESALQSMRESEESAAPDEPESKEDGEADEPLEVAERELLDSLQAEFTAMRQRDPFEILGIRAEATDDEVRAAFARMSKRFHPDRYKSYDNREVQRLAAEIFILVRNAYQHLDTASKRAHTDKVLSRRRAATQTKQAGPVVMPAPPKLKPSVPKPRPPRMEVEEVVDEPTLEIDRPKIGIPQAGGKTRVRGGHVVDPMEDTATEPVVRPDIPASSAPPAVSRPPVPPVQEPPPAAEPPAAEPPAAEPPAAEPPADDPAAAASDPEVRRAYALLDSDKPRDARGIFKLVTLRNPNDRLARIGLELSEGLIALAERDRLEAAQRFEVVLELDPDNRRATEILADMRRQASAERKSHMARLLEQD